MNRNPEPLAWRIPAAFVSAEGRSAGAGSTQRCCNKEHFAAPGLPRSQAAPEHTTAAEDRSGLALAAPSPAPSGGGQEKGQKGRGGGQRCPELAQRVQPRPFQGWQRHTVYPDLPTAVLLAGVITKNPCPVCAAACPRRAGKHQHPSSCPITRSQTD